MNDDLISREALKKEFADRARAARNWKECALNNNNKESTIRADAILSFLTEVKLTIDNAPTVEEIEESFITECREKAIEDNLPLYFVYYEDVGVFEVYVTETRELFEKRRCYKHLPNYAFNNMVNNYLEWYADWRADNDEQGSN